MIVAEKTHPQTLGRSAGERRAPASGDFGLATNGTRESCDILNARAGLRQWGPRRLPSRFNSSRTDPFSRRLRAIIIRIMERPSIQVSLAGMLGLVACVAVNIWLFRLGTLLGIIGLNISKHLIIAYLCQVLGVDKRVTPEPNLSQNPRASGLPVP